MRVPSGARAAPPAFPGLARAVPGGDTGISFPAENWEHWESRAVSPRCPSEGAQEPWDRGELGLCAAQTEPAGPEQSRELPGTPNLLQARGSPPIPTANSCRFYPQEKTLGEAGMPGTAHGGTCGASRERGRTVPGAGRALSAGGGAVMSRQEGEEDGEEGAARCDRAQHTPGPGGSLGTRGRSGSPGPVTETVPGERGGVSAPAAGGQHGPAAPRSVPGEPPAEPPEGLRSRVSPAKQTGTYGIQS